MLQFRPFTTWKYEESEREAFLDGYYLGPEQSSLAWIFRRKIN
jgi:hypothetical protein